MGLGYGNYMYDWNSIMNNPYFLQAWQSKNINFKGSNSSSSTQEASSTSNTSNTSTTQTEAGAIPTTTPTTQESGSSLKTLGGLGLAILGAGGIAWMIKNGKFSQAAKSAKTLFKSGSGETLSCLRAIKTKDGIKFNIPKKTITKSGNQIENFVKNEYCIPEAISAERRVLSSNSVLEGVRVEVGSDSYVIFTKDGNITKVVDKLGNNVTQRLAGAESQSADAKILEGFRNIVAELGKDAKDVDKTILQGVTQIRYVNTYGDDVLKLTVDKYGADPRLREFTTLKRFNFNDAEMQAYQLQAGEEVFADSKFFKDGKLIDGVTVSEFSDKIGGGYIGNFEGQTLVSIKQPNGPDLPVGSAGYVDVVKQHQKDIDKLIHRIFVKRDYVPNGAIIIKA